MKFVDFKCKDCGNIFETVLNNDSNVQVSCEKCGSRNTIRVFSPVRVKSSSGSSEFSNSSSSKSCSSSCASCSSGCS